MTIELPGWRGRLILEVLRDLPDCEGTNKVITEKYIAVAIERGISLPRLDSLGRDNYRESSVRDGIQRMSSDSATYRDRGWHKRNPDLLYRLEPGRWGIRPKFVEMFNSLGVRNDSAIGCLSIGSTRRIITFDDIAPLDDQEVYLLRMIPIPGLIETPSTRWILKVGRAKDVENRGSQLQTGNPCQIVPVLGFRCRNAAELENIVLNASEGVKCYGEWRAFTYEQVLRLGVIMIDVSARQLMGAMT